MVRPTGAPKIERTNTVDLLNPIMALYLADAQEVFKREGREVGRSVVSPSPVTWDGDKDGMLWIRLVTMVPQPVQVGQAAGAYDRCGPAAWTANLALGVIRCSATPDSRGRLPSANRVTEDGLNQVLDMQALADVIEGNKYSRAFQQWNPLPPQGGYAGGEWLFNIRLDNIRVPLQPEGED